MHLFDDSLVRGKWGEEIFQRWFARERPTHTLSPSPAGGAEDRRGIDGRISCTYQIKYDLMAHRTRNVFVETVSVSTTGAPGWAVKCDAAFMFYIIAGHGTVLEFEPSTVTRMLPSWRVQYREREVPNGRYMTRGLPVPIDEFVFHTLARSYYSAMIAEDFASRERLGLFNKRSA